MRGVSRVPDFERKGAAALIDTGAVNSYVDDRLARQLRLPEIDREVVSAALGGARPITTYLAQLYIPSLAFTWYGQFGGLDLVDGGMRFLAVLGRDFLSLFRFSYDGRSGEAFLDG